MICRLTEVAPARPPLLDAREERRAEGTLTVGGGCASTMSLGRVIGRVEVGGRQGLRAGESLRGGCGAARAAGVRDRLPTVMVIAGPQKEGGGALLPVGRAKASAGAEESVCTPPPGPMALTAAESCVVREFMTRAEAARVALEFPLLPPPLALGEEADSAPIMLARVLRSTAPVPPPVPLLLLLALPLLVLFAVEKAEASTFRAESELAVAAELEGAPHSRLTCEALARALAAA